MKPTETGGCSYDECPEYDGKRCRLTGFRPSGCEPAYAALLAEVRASRAAPPATPGDEDPVDLDTLHPSTAPILPLAAPGDERARALEEAARAVDYLAAHTSREDEEQIIRLEAYTEAAGRIRALSRPGDHDPAKEPTP